MTSPTADGGVDEVLSSTVNQVVQQSRIINQHVTRHEEWLAEVRQQTDQVVEGARVALEQAYESVLATASAQIDVTKADLLARFVSAAEAIQQEATANLVRSREIYQQQATKMQGDGAALLESLRSEISVARRHLVEQRALMESAHDEATQTQRRIFGQEYTAALTSSLATVRQERQGQRDDYHRVRRQTISDLNTELSNALQNSVDNYQSALEDSATSLSAEHQRSNDAAISGINTAWTKFTRILVGIVCVSSAIAVAALVVTLL